MAILIFPTESDFESFFEGLKGWKLLSTPGAALWIHEEETKFICVVSGQGKVDCALSCYAAMNLRPNEPFFLLGAATALDSVLRIGDVFAVRCCTEADYHSKAGAGKNPCYTPDSNLARRINEFLPDLTWVHLLSGDEDVFEPTRKEQLAQRYAGQAWTWEGAGFGRFLRRFKAKGIEIRCILEGAEEGALSLKEMKDRRMAFFPSFKKKILEILF